MAIKRVQDKIDNNLGVIRPSSSTSISKAKPWRSDMLKTYETYMENKQHDKKTKWSDAVRSKVFVPVRKRKPIVIYPLPTMIVNRVRAKLTGEKTFPTFQVEGDPETTYLVKAIHKITNFRLNTLNVVSNLLTYGSGFIRFYIKEGRVSLQTFNPNHCYPKFDNTGELEEIEVMFIFEKVVEKKKKKFWYKIHLSKTVDTLFDTPEYSPGQQPTFKIVEQQKHNLGFVQGEWVKTTLDDRKVDGDSLIKDVLEFADCMSYLVSMMDDGTLYSIDPQLVFSGMDNDSLDEVVKSKEMPWALGREGNANFLETSGSGINTGLEVGKSMERRIQDITRVFMHDPEKFSAHGQSGKAMELLNEPMVELIDELRMFMEKYMISVSVKVLAIFIHYARQGTPTQLNLNPSFTPKSIDIVVNWGPVFPLTTQDLNEIVTMYTALTNGNIISRQTALEKLSKYLDIDDVEREVHLVNTQKEFNSWGF